MVRLRQQGQREAKRIWNGVNPDDLDATFNLGTLELTVTTLQREAARLSSAYLSTFIASELGEPERPPALSVWDKAFGGGDLREALRSAVIKTKQAIGEGDDPREATNRNRIVLVNDVGLFIDTAARESLRQGMEMDDRIVGYQRALKGTCGACAGNVAVETRVELPSIPLRIHPNCQCVTEPVVTPSKPRDAYGRMNLTKREDFLRMQQYVGTKQSFWVNERLRYPEVARPGNQPPEFVDRIIRELDDIMGRVASSEKPIQVWRGIVGTPDELGIKAGNVVTDAGYGSTSALRTQVERFMDARIEKYGAEKGLPIIMDLTVDPRVKAVWGANVSESELVLQRGVRYLVESVKREGDRWRVKAKVLPPK
jgi:hypothetical protein